MRLPQRKAFDRQSFGNLALAAHRQNMAALAFDIKLEAVEWTQKPVSAKLTAAQGGSARPRKILWDFSVVCLNALV